MTPLQSQLLAYAGTLLRLQQTLIREIATEQTHTEVLLRIHALLSTHTDALLAYLRTIDPDGPAAVTRLIWASGKPPAEPGGGRGGWPAPG
jgi:hypothetical protein